MEKYPPTPGPWICHSGMVWKPDPSLEDGIPIARMDRETSHTTPVERDANAKLIACAPEMKELLQKLASWFAQQALAHENTAKVKGLTRSTRDALQRDSGTYRSMVASIDKLLKKARH